MLVNISTSLAMMECAS